MDLFKVDSIDECEEKIFKCIKKSNFDLKYEEVELYKSLNRINYEDIHSKEEAPNFNKSTVDGYAVISKDTSGASETVPTFLDIVGESLMGKEQTISINSGECVYVPTGAMLPEGSNAVVMIEHTENLSQKKIAIYSAVGEGQNVIKKADDIKKEELILKRGKKITSGDIALLSSAGVSRVKVYKKINIAIISTGDELEEYTKEKVDIGKIRDSNSIMLSAICEENFINVYDVVKVEDDYDKLYEKVKYYLDKVDIIVLSGGSSKGKKDYTESVIKDNSEEGILTHGISIKPGKPTITGYNIKNKTIIIGLPGHPVACALIFRILIFGIIEFITSAKLDNKYCIGRITENLKAAPGRMTIQLVNVKEDLTVTPILSKSGIVKSLSKADGYIIIKLNDEGINKGEYVKVHYLT